MSEKIRQILLAERTDLARDARRRERELPDILVREAREPISEYNPPERTFNYGTAEYFAEGYRAGFEQVAGSFDGISAIGNLLVGDKESAEKDLARMEMHDKNIQAALSELDTFEGFVDDPTLDGAFKQVARGAGQLIFPAALTIGEGLATGFTATAARTAFTQPGRAALKDLYTSTVRKVGGIRADRDFIPDTDMAMGAFSGQGWQKAAKTPNAFEEMWFKTLQNKGVENLTPEEKVVMDVTRKYLREAKIGGAIGAFAAAETMIAPEILREYQEAGLELGPTEALMATLSGVPAAALDVLAESVFFGAMFKMATQSTRLNKAKLRLQRGDKLNESDMQALAIDQKARIEGVDSLDRIEKEFLKRYEKRSALTLMGDVAKMSLASTAAESATEGLQEEIIMSQRTLVDPSFDNQSQEANLRRMQAYFDGGVGGGGRGLIGGTSAAIFRQSREFLSQVREDKEWAKIQAEKYADLEELGGLPETREDIQAQLNAMVDPDYEREAVWLTTEALAANDLTYRFSTPEASPTLRERLRQPTAEEINAAISERPTDPLITGAARLSAKKFREFLNEAFATKGRKEQDIPKLGISIDPDGFGILITPNPKLREFYQSQRADGANIRNVLAQILQFEPEVEPEDGEVQAETDVVATDEAGLSGQQQVVQLTEDDKVVWEQTTSTSNLRKVVKKAEQQYKGPEKIKNAPTKGPQPEQLTLPGMGEGYTIQYPMSEQNIEDQLNALDSYEQQLLSGIEQAIIDDDLPKMRELKANLEGTKKTRKNLKIVIKSPEEVADERLAANKKDDKEIITRNMVLDGGLDEDEVNNTLKSTTEQYGTSIIGPLAKDQDADLAYETSNLLGMGRSDNEIVQGKKGAYAFSTLPLEKFKLLDRKAQDKVRLQRAEAMFATVRAQLLIDDVFLHTEDSDRVADFNEQLTVLNQGIDKTEKEFTNLQDSETAKALQRTNALALEVFLKDPKNSKFSRNKLTEQYSKLDGSAKRKLIIDSWKKNVDRPVESLELYLQAISNKKKHIKKLTLQREQLIQLRDEFLREAPTTDQSSFSTAKNARFRKTRTFIEEKLLGTIPEDKRTQVLGKDSDPVAFMELLEEVYSDIEDHMLLEPSGAVVSDATKDSIRELIRKNEAILAQRDLDIIINRQNKARETRSKLRRENKNNIVNPGAVEGRIAKENLVERADNFFDDSILSRRRLEALEMVAENYVLGEQGVALSDLGYRQGESITSTLGGILEDSKSALYDPEVYRANGTILEVLKETQEADPNSIYEIVGSSAAEAPASDFILNPKTTRTIEDTATHIMMAKKIKKNGEGFDALQIPAYIEAARSVANVQGQKIVVSFEALDSKYGPQAREIKAFLNQLKDINISDDYQSIVKKITPESEVGLYGAKYIDGVTGKQMPARKAVQKAVSNARQINRDLSETEHINKNEYTNIPGSMPLKYGWFYRSYNKKNESSDNALAMNEVLSAGVSIIESRLDSIERSTADFNFKLATGFGHLLSDGHLISFQDMDGKNGDIVFKYRTYDKKKKEYTAIQEIVVKDFEQRIEDKALQGHLKPTAVIETQTIKEGKDGEVVEGVKTSKYTTRVLVDKKSRVPAKYIRFNPTVFKKAIKPDYFMSEKPYSATSMKDRDRIFENEYSLFNLPIYYNPKNQRATDQHQSAQDLMEESQQTPFYYTTNESGQVTIKKLRKEDLHSTIRNKKKMLANPDAEDVADVKMSEVEGLVEGLNESEKEGALLGYGSIEAVEDRIKAIYLDKYKLPKESFDDEKFLLENLDIKNDLVLEEIYTGLQEGVDFVGFDIAQKLGYNVVGLAPQMKQFGRKQKALKTESLGLMSVIYGEDPNLVQEGPPVPGSVDVTGVPVKGLDRLRQQRIAIRKAIQKTMSEPPPKIPVTTVVPFNKNKQGKNILPKGAVNVLRNSKKPNEHYGNPFVFSKELFENIKKKGTKAILVKNRARAVNNYRDWLNGKMPELEPERRQWILDQIKQGKLDGKKLAYSTGGKATASSNMSHANVLAEAVNKRTLNKLDQQKSKTKVIAGMMDPKVVGNVESYSARTEIITRTSDAIVMFAEADAKGFFTPGSQLTKNLAERYGKPILINPTSEYEIINFLTSNKVKKLMIAGSGLDVNLLKETKYDQILHDALKEVKDLQGKKGKELAEFKRKALETPEKFVYPSLEEENEILDAMIIEANLKIKDPSVYATYIGDQIGTSSDSDPLNIAEDLEGEAAALARSKRMVKTDLPLKTVLSRQQVINGEVIDGVQDLDVKNGIYIEDDVSRDFEDLEVPRGEDAGTLVANQLLSLRRKKLSDLTFAEKRAKEIIEQKTNKIFATPRDLYLMYKQLGQDLNLDVAKAGRIVDPIKRLSEIARDKLGLKRRKIFIMFDDKLIKFSDPELNRAIQNALFEAKEPASVNRDGKQVTELLTWAENYQAPEKYINRGNVDVIVLKRPSRYQNLIKQDLQKAGLPADLLPDTSELEGVVAGGLVHGFGHSFFNEYVTERTLQETKEGRAIYKEWQNLSKEATAPTQWKDSVLGFEEYIADLAGGDIFNTALAKRKESDKFIKDLTKRYQTTLSTMRVSFAKSMGLRLNRPKQKTFTDFVAVVKEQFRGTQKDRGSGTVTAAVREQLDLFDTSIKEKLVKEKIITRDMKLDDVLDKYDEVVGTPGSAKEAIDKLNDMVRFTVSSSTDYLRFQGADDTFVNMLNRETQSPTGLGFVQEEVDEYQRVINSLFKPLATMLDIPVGTWGDDTEIGAKHRPRLRQAFIQYSADMKIFGEKELRKQLKNPKYLSPKADKKGREQSKRVTASSLHIFKTMQKIKRQMELNGLAVRENHDLTRNYDIEAISVKPVLFNTMARLIYEAEGNDVSYEESVKAVEEAIKNREQNDTLIKDDEELSPYVASLAIGMSPKRAQLFKNVSTYDLVRYGLVTDILDSQIQGIRNIVKKYMYNNKVQKVLRDEEILRARELVGLKRFKTPSGNVVDDASFLEFLAEKETRAEQKKRISKTGKKGKKKEDFTEAPYLLRGWQAATAYVWLDPNVKDPIAVSNTVGAITGKIGLEINSMPYFRSAQSGAMLLNQMTFLTFSGLSSLPELAGPAIQRGDFEGLLLTFQGIGKNLRNKEEVDNFLLALGTMGISQSLENSVYAGDMAWATSTTQEWSKFFFKSIGVTKLMGFLYRNAAFVSYKAIEMDTKRALQGDAKSIERLAVIGLTPNVAKKALTEVDFLKKGDPKTFPDYENRLKGSSEARQFRNSMQKLIKEMVLKPTSAQRTVWMNNPFFALIAQLKPFYYSFGKNYIGGTYKNMQREYRYGNYVGALLPPMILVAGMLPLAAIGLHLRELFKFIVNGGDPEQFKAFNQSTPTLMLDLVDRAGLLGRAGLLVPMFEAEMYGSTFFSPGLGPTIERGIDVIEGRGNIWDYVPYAGAFGYD